MINLNVPISLGLKNHRAILELHRDCQGCQIPNSDSSFLIKNVFGHFKLVKMILSINSNVKCIQNTIQH